MEYKRLSMNNQNMEYVLILGAVKNATVNIYKTGSDTPTWTGITDSTGKAIKSLTDPSLPLLSYGDYDILIDKCDYDPIAQSFNVPNQTVLALTAGCSSAISTHEVTYDHSLISTSFIISATNFKKIASLNVRNSSDYESYREANDVARPLRTFILEDNFVGSMNVYFEARSSIEGQKTQCLIRINDEQEIWYKPTYSSSYTSFTVLLEGLNLPKKTRIHIGGYAGYGTTARRYFRNCRLMYDDSPIETNIITTIETEYPPSY